MLVGSTSQHWPLFESYFVCGDILSPDKRVVGGDSSWNVSRDHTPHSVGEAGLMYFPSFWKSVAGASIKPDLKAAVRAFDRVFCYRILKDAQNLRVIYFGVIRENSWEEVGVVYRHWGFRVSRIQGGAVSPLRVPQVICCILRGNVPPAVSGTPNCGLRRFGDGLKPRTEMAWQDRPHPADCPRAVVARISNQRKRRVSTGVSCPRSTLRSYVAPDGRALALCVAEQSRPPLAVNGKALPASRLFDKPASRIRGKAYPVPVRAEPGPWFPSRADERRCVA
jgi:hypothetical protein